MKVEYDMHFIGKKIKNLERFERGLFRIKNKAEIFMAVHGVR